MNLYKSIIKQNHLEYPVDIPSGVVGLPLLCRISYQKAQSKEVSAIQGGGELYLLYKTLPET